MMDKYFLLVKMSVNIPVDNENVNENMLMKIIFFVHNENKCK